MKQHYETTTALWRKAPQQGKPKKLYVVIRWIFWIHVIATYCILVPLGEYSFFEAFWQTGWADLLMLSYLQKNGAKKHWEEDTLYVDFDDTGVTFLYPRVLRQVSPFRKRLRQDTYRIRYDQLEKITFVKFMRQIRIEGVFDVTLALWEGDRVVLDKKRTHMVNQQVVTFHYPEEAPGELLQILQEHFTVEFED